MVTVKIAKEARRSMHMSATREFLLRFIDNDPEAWRHIVIGAKDRAEARQFIADGPRFHPLGDCPDYDYEKGVCPGHDDKPPVHEKP